MRLIAAELQERSQGEGRGLAVIHHQDSSPLGRKTSVSSGRFRWGSRRLVLGQRQLHRELAATAWTVTLGRDAALMQLHQLLDQRQTNAQPPAGETALAF